MQARRGLIQDVERLAGLAAVQLLGELHALRLAARERRSGLPQAYVAQAHIVERLQLALDLRDVAKERERLGHAHIEHVRDGLAAVGHLERLAVIALAPADFAGHVDVRQEVHLDLDLAVALAGLAAASRHVEAEAPRAVAARLRLRNAREERPQVVPEPNIGGRVGARRAPDGRLVDIDDLIDLVEPLELLVRPHKARGMMDGVGERRCQRIGNKRALARARNARHHGEGAELDLRRHVLEVVGARPGDLKAAALGFAPLFRQANHAPARKVGAGERAGARHDFLRGTRAHDLATVLSRPGAHIDHEIRSADGVLVVLDHDDGIAQVAKALKRSDEPLVISLMQADRRLVQNVQDAHETGADLRGKADALRLATGERGGSAVKREVIEAHVHQEA